MTNAAGALCGDFGRIALIDIADPVKPHVHPHAHLLFKVGGADSSFRVSRHTVAMTSDTAVLVNCWEPHGYPRAPGQPSSLVLGLYIEPAWLEVVDPWFQLTSGDQLFDNPSIDLTPKIRTLLHEAADAARGVGIAARAAEHLVASLMCEVTRRVTPGMAQSRRRGPRRFSGRDFRIRRSLEVMRRQISTPWGMAQIARMSGISRAHFFEVFKAEIGVTPLMYFHALRMEAAYEALLGMPGTVQDVASRLGFCATPHFTRFFREHLGTTPSDFRHAAMRNHRPARGASPP
jgi:AraC family transcriptional regulator